MRIAFDFMNNPNPTVFYKELVGFICFWIFKFSFWRLLLIVICWNICCTPSDYPEQAVQIQQSFYDTSPHESFSKADRFGLQRQHLCDEQQGSHEGEIFAGKACIFRWLSSSVLPERNGKGHWKGGECAATQWYWIGAVRAQGMRITFDFMKTPNPTVYYKELVGFICFWIFKFSFWRLLLIVVFWNICCTPSRSPWTSSPNPAKLKLLWQWPTWIL